VAVIELDAKLRVGKGLHHLALNKEWFFFGHRFAILGKGKCRQTRWYYVN
jgi:hypothetical protein